MFKYLEDKILPSASRGVKQKGLNLTWIQSGICPCSLAVQPRRFYLVWMAVTPRFWTKPVQNSNKPVNIEAGVAGMWWQRPLLPHNLLWCCAAAIIFGCFICKLTSLSLKNMSALCKKNLPEVFYFQIQIIFPMWCWTKVSKRRTSKHHSSIKGWKMTN